MFRWFMIALSVLVLASFVFQKLFWWLMIASGVVMFAGAVVETFWNWRQERALGRQPEEETPTEAPAAGAPSRATIGRER
jgi:uncharacterized protein (DUF58 family)